MSKIINFLNKILPKKRFLVSWSYSNEEGKLCFCQNIGETVWIIPDSFITDLTLNLSQTEFAPADQTKMVITTLIFY